MDWVAMRYINAVQEKTGERVQIMKDGAVYIVIKEDGTQTPMTGHAMLAEVERINLGIDL